MLIAFLLILSASAAWAESNPIPTEAIGVNSRGDRLEWLDFEAGTVQKKNNDSQQLFSPRSVAVGPSLCEQRIDAFVGDTFGGLPEGIFKGDILRYRGAVGTGQVICAGTNNNCPNFPRGLSRDGTGTLAAGDLPVNIFNGARVWIMAPESCPGDSFDGALKLDRGICLDNGEGCTPVLDVIDTEFLKAPVGGLEAGGLVVLTILPSKLLHYSRAAILCRLDGECGPDAEPDVLASLPPGNLPAGVAVLPGGEILVSFAQGGIKAYEVINGQAVQTNTPFASGLGFGLEGIDAGLDFGEESVVVAHRLNDRYYKFDVLRGGSGPVGSPAGSLRPDQNDPRPRDAAVNDTQAEGTDCVENEFDFGCPLTTLNVVYNGQEPPPGSTVQETVSLAVCDPRNLGDVNNPPPSLNLSDLGFTGDLGTLVVPPYLVGIPIPGDPSGCRALIVSEVTKSFPIEPEAWVELRGNAEDVLPGIGDCPATFGRIAYHPVLGQPWPEGSEFADISLFCDNPRRGMGRDNSFVVQGSSWLLEIQDLNDVDFLELVNDEAIQRLDNLVTTLNGVLASRPILRGKLINAATIAKGFLTPLGPSSTPAQFREGFRKARTRCFNTASFVASRRDRFNTEAEVGDVLSRFANCALFLAEEGRGQPNYEPPFMDLAGQDPPPAPPIIP